MIYRRLNSFLFLVFLVPLCVFANFSVPALTGRVVDQAGFLSPKAYQLAQEASRKIEAKTGAQVAFLSVQSLEGESIEQASILVVDQWKLGDAKKDNGVLLMLSKGDRKLRIEVGQGLEGSLTDLRTKRIIDQEIRPYFKNGDFDSGIVAGMYAIAHAIDPTVDWSKECACQISSRASHNIPWVYIFLIFIFVVVFVSSWSDMRSSQTNMRGTRYRNRDDHWGGGFGGGPWMGGGGSGGGFSGGGGGFSGGGASGDW